jgi:plastocyanin
MKSRKNTEQPLSKSRKKLIFQCLVGVLILVVLIVAVNKIFFKEDYSQQRSSNEKVAVVRITENGFEPSTITVKQGTRVVWTNTDTALHQIISNPYPEGTDLPGLRSEILDNNQAYTYVANTAGSFGYHDQQKPTLNGTLVVEKE